MIGKNIGEGTFGKVKAGTHNITGEKVSIWAKMLMERCSGNKLLIIASLISELVRLQKFVKFLCLLSRRGYR